MNSGRVLMGLIFAAVGVVLLLDNAGTVDAGEVLSTWWPAVVIAGGVLAMLSKPPALLAGGAVMLIGLAALGVTTEVLAGIGWGGVAGVALIALGGMFVIGQRGPKGASSDERIEAICVFSGREISSSARPFRGGSITGVFGGVELDLTGAVLEDGAILDVVAIFGGAEITVPPGWRVQISGPAIFGGTEDGTGRQVLPADAPILTIRALALFGGVEVKLGAAPIDLSAARPQAELADHR